MYICYYVSVSTRTYLFSYVRVHIIYIYMYTQKHMEIRRSCRNNLQYFVWPHELESPLLLNAWSLLACLFLLEHETAGFWLIPLVLCCTFGEHARAIPGASPLLIQTRVPPLCWARTRHIPTHHQTMTFVIRFVSNFTLPAGAKIQLYVLLLFGLKKISMVFPLLWENVRTALREW